MARSSQRMTDLFRRQMAKRERVSQGTVLRPVGDQREVVLNKDCNNPRLMSTLTPMASSAPGSIVPVLGAGGGSGLVAAESTITGKDAGNEEQGHTVPGLPLVVSSIALMATDTTGGNLTVDVAAFLKDLHVETLWTGLVLSGIADPIDVGFATRQLTQARSISGLSGITDGSILLHTLNRDPSPWETTVHVIDIGTGEVFSRVFVPGFSPFGDPLQAVGWAIQDGVIYFMMHSPSEERIVLVSFPPKLTSQTTLNDKNYFSAEANVQFGTQFFAADALNTRGITLITWDRVPFGGGALTESFVTGGLPDPGTSLAQHPYSLGLFEGKYWTMGQGPPTGIGPFDFDIKPFFVNETTIVEEIPIAAIDRVATNGWEEMAPGLGFGKAFYQFRNGQRLAGHDIDPGGMYGFPIFTTPGPDASDGVPGLMFLPFAATSWAGATFIEIDTSEFSPDMMIADRRDI